MRDGTGVHNRDNTDNDILNAAARGRNDQLKPTQETDFIYPGSQVLGAGRYTEFPHYSFLKRDSEVVAT